LTKADTSKELHVAAQRAVPVRAASAVVAFGVGVGTALVVLLVTQAPAFAAPEQAAGTPCPVSAKACLDLTTQRAWLVSNGTVTRGPVPVSTGGPGQETPTGTFHVLAKDKNHVSTEQGGTPMPDAVFFAPGGIAFHGGSLRKASAGCVHLDDADALAFYDTLKLGDEVDVLATTPPARKPKRQRPSTQPATPVLPRTPSLPLSR
jgi:hypothetical protein